MNVYYKVNIDGNDLSKDNNNNEKNKNNNNRIAFAHENILNHTNTRMTL